MMDENLGLSSAGVLTAAVKARNLLDAIGRYPDAQGAFALFRSCTGWAKVLYSCGTVPPRASRPKA